jgi:hypothetical protein
MNSFQEGKTPIQNLLNEMNILLFHLTENNSFNDIKNFLHERIN